MRTTLTLEPDVADRLKRRMRGSKRSLKATVNEALRIGLGLQPAAKGEPFVVRPHASAFAAGVDPGRLNQLVDELEVRAASERRGAR